LIEDDEGQEIQDAGSIRSEALASARELLAGAIIPRREHGAPYLRGRGWSRPPGVDRVEDVLAYLKTMAQHKQKAQ